MQLQLHHNRSTNANGTDNFNTGDPHQQQDVQDVQDKEISSEQKSKGDEKRGDDDAAVPVGSNTTTDKPSQTGADTDKSPSTATTTEHYPHSDAATDMDDSDPPFSSPPDEDNHSGATPFAKSSDKDVKSAQDSSEADGVATDSDGNSVAGETENDGFRLSKAEVWTFLGVIVSLLLISVLICNIQERKRNRQHARYNCVCIVFFCEHCFYFLPCFRNLAVALRTAERTADYASRAIAASLPGPGPDVRPGDMQEVGGSQSRSNMRREAAVKFNNSAGGSVGILRNANCEVDRLVSIALDDLPAGPSAARETHY